MLASIFTFFVFLSGCSTDSIIVPANKYDSLTFTELQQEYQTQIIDIKKQKSTIEELDSLGRFFHHKMTEEIFPAWYGTTWDYNGYSNNPREGEIACGYFVSTPLKHIGFNLNRYALAKKYSSSIVKSLCSNNHTFTDIDALFEHLLSQNDNLYVVGLSNHVGFLEKKGDAIYFIHSNYFGPVAVEKEIANESNALNASDIFVLGNLSGDQELMKKWKNNTPITIID